MKNKELTILLPVLNEEKTIGTCIEKAQKFIKKHNIEAEILISDNNSSDNSCKIAKKMGTRITHIQKQGYGNALIHGIKEAKGTYIIMADADDSYDLENMEQFMEKLYQGYDLVVGNRFKGGIQKGAMPFLHRIGAPFLSFIGRCVSRSKVGDFHCGIRGFNKQAIVDLGLKCEGMEFASEMIVKAEKKRTKNYRDTNKIKKRWKNWKVTFEYFCRWMETFKVFNKYIGM